MHLLLVADDAYVPHVGTMVCSVLENNRQMSFVVHILTTNISNDNVRMMRQMVVDSYHQQLDIQYVNPDELDIDVEKCGSWGIFPSLKLYAAELFPDVDRMLYVDADMVCIASLKYIENLDISDYYLAAPPDNQGCWRHKVRLDIPMDNFYGCGGLMYFNLKRWREEGLRERCLSWMNDPANADKIHFGEQDVINKVCTGHILELPIEYNMFMEFYAHSHSSVPDKYRTEWERHKRNAVIIHYAGWRKPWHKDCLFPLKKYYRKYARLTPWGYKDLGYSQGYPGFWHQRYYEFLYFLHRIGLRVRDYQYDA